MESSKLEQLIKLLSRENVKLKEKVAMLQDQLRIIHNFIATKTRIFHLGVIAKLYDLSTSIFMRKS